MNVCILCLTVDFMYVTNANCLLVIKVLRESDIMLLPPLSQLISEACKELGF